MAQERDIKYINREFSDFRGQLIEFAKNYFPDTYNDFSPTSPGMMFIEMASYVGDVLSFYQDTQLQETFLQHAKDPGNLYTLAYMMGYRPKVSSASEVDLDISLTVDASGSAPNIIPNYTQAGKVEENSTLIASTSTATPFVLQKTVDFNFSSSYDPTVVTITGLDGSGNPTEYTLTKKGKAFSSEITTTTRTFDTVEKFATITIDDEDIIGILSIEDENSNIWYEVPFLGQDTIFTEETNSSDDSGLVPNNLTLIRTNRRFVTRFNSSGQLQIQFGAGITGDTDADITPSPLNVGLGTSQGVSRLDIAYDPSNFLFTQTYGLAPPAGTTLTIKYLKGGGISANEPSGTVNSFVTALTTPDTSGFRDRLSVTNPAPATGGKNGDTIEELRQNSLRSFNEQGRVVSLKDYAIRALSLPTRFGSISKAYATQDQLSNTNSNVDLLIDDNPLAISLYILSQDIDGKLTTASTSLKNNLKNYLSQYTMITDAVNIKDAFVVNIGVQFEILPLPNYAGRDVLLNCTNRLIEYFNISNWSINQPINLSPIFTLLDKVKGVQSVQKIKITNKTGTVGGKVYSQYAYDVEGATRGNIVYPSLDPCIFEVKYPTADIQGRITTL
jgi:hypothetical protein